MGEPTDVAHEILLVGLNHRTAPVEIRERLAFADGRLEQALRALVAWPGVAEGVIVSTCNRVEVVACGSDATTLAAELPRFLAEEHGVDPALLAGRLYSYRGREAVRHLFRVAASLDSMVVGEPQILGQLKTQYAVAAAVGASGRVLHRCFHRSFSVAKRIRTETAIAERAVSIGSVAVDLAREIFDSLADKTVLLIGAGAMGELTARQLLSHGAGSLLVVNRTWERALAVAHDLGGLPVPFERLDRYLPLADLVVGAIAGAEGYAVGPVAAQEALRERRGKPVFFIDLAVPRSIDPAVHALDGAYVYDIDDLDGVIAANRDAREAEAARAEAIVDSEVETFWRWLEGLDVVPTIVALRERVEAIREREVERVLAGQGPLEPGQRELVERVTRAICNKLLHVPLTVLRRNQGGAGAVDTIAAARTLFALDPVAPSDPDDEPGEE